MLKIVSAKRDDHSVDVKASLQHRLQRNDIPNPAMVYSTGAVVGLLLANFVIWMM